VGLCVAAWSVQRRPELVLGLGVAVLPLLPRLYLPALHDSLFAERYLHLPCAGMAILLAAGIDAWPKVLPRVVVALAIVAAGTASLLRTEVWRDSLTLWTDAAHKAPESPVANEFLGGALLAAGRNADAVAPLERAIEIDPTRTDARCNLATALASLGRPREAIFQATFVLMVEPSNPGALAARGWALAVEGRFAEALADYEDALSRDPMLVAVHNNAGIVCARLGRPDLAAAHFRQALRLDPANGAYARNLAMVAP